jgi:chemotaxis family two-component system sensor kinase Cph1
MAKSEHKPTTVDITNCDRELIHIPGAILPHGALLVLEANRLEVLQAAGNTAALLGVAIQELLGRSAATLFRSDQVENLHALAKTYDLAKPRHLLDPLLRVLPDHPLDASLHRSGGSLVLEFETADTADRFAADPLAGGFTKWSRGWTRRSLSRHSASSPRKGYAA